MPVTEMIDSKHPLNELLETAVSALSELDTEKLRAELAKAFRVTVEQIVRMAAIIRILEDRGDNLDDLKFGLLGYLRKVAYGQVMPEVVVKLQSAPLLMARVASLPIPDQKRVITEDPIKVTVIDDGVTTHRLISPLKMNASEIRQVFARDHIRDESEQISWIRSRPSRAAQSTGNNGIQVDAKRKGIVVTGERVFISRSEMVNLLARVTD